MFGGSSLVAVSPAYFIGMAAIICSGIMLKMELPHTMCLHGQRVPHFNLGARLVLHQARRLRHLAFATVVLWFMQGFGFENGVFGMVEDQDNPCWLRSLPRSHGSLHLWASATGVQLSLPSPA